MTVLVVILVLVIFNFIIMPVISIQLSRGIAVLTIGDFLQERKKLKFMKGSDIPRESDKNLYFFNDFTGVFPKKPSQRKGMALQGILHEKTTSEKRMLFSRKELIYKYAFILKGEDGRVFLGEIDAHIFKSFSSYIIYITQEVEGLSGATPKEYRRYLKGVVTERKRAARS